MGYFTPDFSGTKDEYKVKDDNFIIFQTGQRLTFKHPVFLDTLKVTQIGTVNTTLVKDVNWQVTTDRDYDYDAMAKAKVYSANFNKILVKSIVFIGNVVNEYQVSLTYQSLYPSIYLSMLSDDGTPMDINPDYVRELEERLSSLGEATRVVGNTSSGTNVAPAILPLDKDEENPDTNTIKNELHVVNVYDGINIIRPVQGAFFKGSVVVKTNDGTPLVENTDFVVFGIDLARTKASRSKNDVYNFIMITKAIADTLVVQYHAYGGEATLADISAIWAIVNDIKMFLENSNFATEVNIATMPVITNTIQRMETLESRMRSLVSSGSPSYGDATTGKTTVRNIRAVDSNLHWWNIATLYTVDGGNDEVTIADRMKFRIKLLNANLMADVFVSANLLADDKLVVDSAAVQQDLGYVSLTSYDNVPVAMPQFRIIYNDIVDNNSGVILQIGMTLPNLTETIAIEDTSGKESCWILLGATEATPTPNDNTVTLPNSDYIWSTSNSNSRSYAHMLPNKSGYLAWAGTLNLSTVALQTDLAMDHLLTNNFLVNDVKSISFEILEGTRLTRYTMPVTAATLDTYTRLSGIAYLDVKDTNGTPMGIKLFLTKNNTTNAISLNLRVESVLEVPASKALRHIIVNF